MIAARTRSPKPPSRLVRGIARVGVPLGVLFGLLALLSLTGLVVGLVRGPELYRAFISIAWVGGVTQLAYSVGIELPKQVSAWDAALTERGEIMGVDRPSA